MATTPESFLSKLESSRLFTPEQFNSIREWIDSGECADRRSLLNRLMEKGWITEWQAGEIGSGRYKFYLGQYRLMESLGAGGRGMVYKAEHTSMGRRMVALKVMAQELMDKPEAVARFRREVESSAALNHPNIIQAFDAAQDGDTHFLVMEYVKGRDLFQWVRKFGKLPVAWSAECIRQSALGLQHAHEKGMVHRDIKPGNILVAAETLDDFPNAKVLDLGCAFFMPDNSDGPRLTQAYQTFGTPDYIAPEQAESAMNADIRSDIFSLGCTLYRILTNEVPYKGATQLQKLLARASHDAPRVREARPEVPAGLEAVIAKMMARRADERYQTPKEVAEALTPFSLSATESTTEAEKPAPVLSIPPAPAPSPSAEFAETVEATGISPLIAPALSAAISPASASSPTVSPSQLRGAVLGGLFVGGLLGAVVGLALGFGIFYSLRAQLPGELWQTLAASCTVAGLSLGSAYKATLNGLTALKSPRH